MDVQRLNPSTSIIELARIQRKKYKNDYKQVESIFQAFDDNDFSFRTVKVARKTSWWK